MDMFSLGALAEEYDDPQESFRNATADLLAMVNSMPSMPDMGEVMAPLAELGNVGDPMMGQQQPPFIDPAMVPPAMVGSGQPMSQGASIPPNLADPNQMAIDGQMNSPSMNSLGV